MFRYPSSLEYQTVAMTLLKKYPFLADKNEQNKLVSIGINDFILH